MGSSDLKLDAHVEEVWPVDHVNKQLTSFCVCESLAVMEVFC